MSLRLPYYFWLGFRGFVGALAWLVAAGDAARAGPAARPGAPLLGFLGALLLALVLLYLPFLQMRLAATNRLSAVFDAAGGAAPTSAGRRGPSPSPSCVTLLFALPLYLLKIEMVPREAAWLPSLVFIAFIFPARLLTGWASAAPRRRRDAAPLVLPLDRPAAAAAGGGVLRADRLLHAVHELERRLEPVRAARLPAAGAVLRHVMPHGPAAPAPSAATPGRPRGRRAASPCGSRTPSAV